MIGSKTVLTQDSTLHKGKVSRYWSGFVVMHTNITVEPQLCGLHFFFFFFFRHLHYPIIWTLPNSNNALVCMHRGWGQLAFGGVVITD